MVITEAADIIFKSLVNKFPNGKFTDNAYYESGVIQYDKNNYKEAKTNFETVTLKFPDSDVLQDSYKMLGETQIALSEFANGVKTYSKLISLNNVSKENLYTGYFNLAWCSLKSKNYADAVKQFNKFLQDHPNGELTEDASFWFSESYFLSGDFKNSIKHYASFLNNFKNSKRFPEALYGLAWSYFKANEFSNAAQTFEEFTEKYPNSEFTYDSYLRLAECYYNLKDYDKGSGIYRLLIRQHKDNKSTDFAFYQLAQTEYRAGDFGKAIDEFKNLLKKLS